MRLRGVFHIGPAERAGAGAGHVTDLATDYASRIRAARDIVERLGPDRRDPHRFLEEKDEALKSLDQLADEVQLDQVFAKLPPHPVAGRASFQKAPRVVADRKGRLVAVEVRRARRSAAG